jgi:hypothetical protein
MDDHNVPTGKKRKSSKPSTSSPSRVPISEGSQATGKPSSSQRCSQSSSGTLHAASTAFDTRRQSNKARMTKKKRALRADSGGRSVKIVSPLPEHQNDALNISSNAISHLGAEHRATRTTLVNSTHVSQADRREEAGNVKRILAGNEQEHQDAAHDQQSTIASSGNDYGPCPFADLSASALDPARTSSTQSTSHEPRNAASRKVIQKEMFFSFDAGNFDDGQNVP